MQHEEKDHRLKYVEMSAIFQRKAFDLEISAKQQNKACEKYAIKIAGIRPKTAEEFERVEAMKEFILKTSEMNDNVILMIDYFRGLINEIIFDYEILEPGAKLRDSLREAQNTIVKLMESRDKNVTNEYIRRKDQINSK